MRQHIVINDCGITESGVYASHPVIMNRQKTIGWQVLIADIIGCIGKRACDHFKSEHAGLAGGQIAPVPNCSFSFYPFELKLSRIVEHKMF